MKSKEDTAKMSKDQYSRTRQHVLSWNQNLNAKDQKYRPQQKQRIVVAMQDRLRVVSVQVQVTCTMYVPWYLVLGIRTGVTLPTPLRTVDSGARLGEANLFL